MTDFLWMIPMLPLAGFLLLALFGRRMGRGLIAWTGAGTVGISAAVSLIIAGGFILHPPAGNAITHTYWTWFSIGSFAPEITFRLDSLSLIFILIITFVGFLIHLYSVEFMYVDEAYSRFFAYMNLFVGSMLILILAGDLLLLYLGWEGVGLCSYLLIGFWYRDAANGYAARKAFIVTRVGDTAMALGMFILINNFMTLNIQEIANAAPAAWQTGSLIATAAAALLLGGALGKSAQLPLQTWLPDAMAGPTPVSALIHAATMVTAGVYLVARMHAVFQLSPVVMQITAIIGAATLLLAGFSAFVQTNIKKVLAYSTISQIGYMFVALGVGAWSAAVFHFVTHAFFKALLFLGAGAIIYSLHHEHDMRKMGGLRTKLPLVYRTFVIGAASLSALPLITAGFFSKDMILWYAYAGVNGGKWLWCAGIAGAFLTSLYSFRMVFLTFFGEAKTELGAHPGWKMNVPLVVLAVFAVAGGYIELPESLAHFQFFSGFLGSALPALPHIEAPAGLELKLQTISAISSLAGIFSAYVLYIRFPLFTGLLMQLHSVFAVNKFLFSGWGFDKFYDVLVVRPLVWLANINKNDIFDSVNRWLTVIFRMLHIELSLTQSGLLRWCLAGIVSGAVVITAMAVFL